MSQGLPRRGMKEATRAATHEQLLQPGLTVEGTDVQEEAADAKAKGLAKKVKNAEVALQRARDDLAKLMELCVPCSDTSAATLHEWEALRCSVLLGVARQSPALHLPVHVTRMARAARLASARVR